MEINKNVIDFPETWDELTIKDWSDILKFRQKLLTRKKGFKFIDVLCESARILLLNRRIKTRYSNEKYYLLIYKIAVGLQWLWRENNDQIELVYKSTINLLPKYNKLIGPRSHGEDMTFGEFKTAITLVENYAKTGDKTMLYALAGTLYRHKAHKGSGLWREKFDGNIDEAINRAKMMPDWFVWGIYAWFAYFCEYLYTGDFIIDGETVNFAVCFQKSGGISTDNKTNLGMNAIAFSIAESGIFGNVTGVEDTQLIRVMMKLLHDYNTIQELKTHK